MKLPRTNIEKRLNKIRSRSFDGSTWKAQIEKIFQEDELQEKRILDNLEKASKLRSNNFDFDILETQNIYHLEQIKKICIDYRLRFLDSKFFKGSLPKEAVFKIKELEKKHYTEIKGFKIIAPSKLFKLEDANDPLLFAPVGNDYFYLIHTWGNDLHPFRKLFMWFFKSFENLVILTFLISLVLTLIIPDSLFTKNNSLSTSFMIFLFMFKSVAAVILFYGFALGKNFNSAIWNSKYFNT